MRVDTRKALALSAYLAVNGRPESRDLLAALFWPDYDEDHARASLRRTLSTLGAALRGEWLEARRDAIALKRGEGLRVDVWAFRERLAEVARHAHRSVEDCPTCPDLLREAVDLYQGDFMSGFALRECVSFEEWQSFHADGLRRELGGALERLAAAYAARGDFDAAIDRARRWLALDSLHEAAHRQLMLLYAWTGGPALALRQYRDCARVLAEELGVSPLPETAELAEAIKEHRAPAVPSRERPPAEATWAGAIPAPRPARAAYPLVGRATEWNELVRAYESASGELVVLEGEAGIGKTRLADELIGYARASGASAIAARSYEGAASLAYGLFADVLRSALASGAERAASVPEHWLREAARLLPELGELRPGLEAPAPLESAAARSRFFEGVTQLVLALLATTRPGLLFLDDLHWTDAASLDLLEYLLQRFGGRPVLILAAWRSERVPPAQRLRRLVGDAKRRTGARTLLLQRLTPVDVAALVGSAASRGAAIPPELRERVFREAEGVPFFVVEYLEAIGSGAAALQEIPAGAQELLRSRLVEVGEPARQLLTTAAVIGRSFDLDVLREASGRSAEETVAGLEELVSHGLAREIDARPGSAVRFDFTHDLLREVAYRESSLARRRLLHRRVAETLLKGPGRGREAGAAAVEVATHLHLAGQDAEAAEWFFRAGQHARALYANAEALSHFQTALALGHPDVAGLHEGIGDLQTLSGDYRAALASFELAAAQCEPGRAAALEHRLGDVYRRRGEWERAEAHFEAARAGLGETGHEGERARLLADWSLIAHRQRRADEALDLARRAIRLAEAAVDARALAQSHNILGILASDRGELDVARDHLERSLALAETLDDPSARVAALNNLALACLRRGELDRGLALAETALALCVAQGDRHREAALHSNIADLLHALGRSEDALAHLKRAAALFAEIGADERARLPEIWKLTEW